MASFRPAKLRRTAEINHTPVSWESYFDRHFNVQVPGSGSGSGSGNGAPAAAGGAAAAAAGGGGSNSFRFYEVGPEEADPMLPVVLLLHGGGLSAMSWAVCVKEMAQRAGACRFLAMDARGHGDSTVVDGDYELDRDVLCQDVAAAVHARFGDAPPPIAVVGHSMGGAIAVHLADQQLLPSMAALTVIDVVEGSAKAALPEMLKFLGSRPDTFATVEHAIGWALKGGQTKNVASARVSMPMQLCLQTPAGDSGSAGSGDGGSGGGGGGAAAHGGAVAATGRLTWKVDLAKTEPHWLGWFQGLSKKFLDTKVPKLLVLAGINTLDVELTVGQMQGKFQLAVVENVGHAVHEDAPGKVADIVVTFLSRFKHLKKNAQCAFYPPAC